jgi:hypothetical protein
MRFEKGHPKPQTSGRKKGTPNKKKILKVADVLADQNIDPTKKILNIIPTLEPEDQVKAWLDLLSYCQAKPKDSEPDGDDDNDPDELDEVPTDNILEIYRKAKGTA